MSSRSLASFERLLRVADPAPETKKTYGAAAQAETVSVRKRTQVIKGFRTSNALFHQEIMGPIIARQRDQLTRLHPVDRINQLTLFGYENYQVYFGKSFYRWGGDIFDLDDPQEQGARFDRRYGLDCSGFATMPYEIAVAAELLDAADPGAHFSSKGFERLCSQGVAVDRGGRNGTSNNFRLDSQELVKLGREVFRLEKGAAPSEDQLRSLQAGDIVARNGHVGIIVEIDAKPYYLESGGPVIYRTGGDPVHARDALKIFATTGPITIRRALADRGK